MHDKVVGMAYDEGLAFRLRELLDERRDVVEKAMFGGLAFLIDGSMSVGVVGDDLLVRVGSPRHELALSRPHARVMDFTGRPMKGWVFVAAAGIEDDAALAGWVEWGVQAARQASDGKGKGVAPPAGAPARKSERARKPTKKKPARR